jgi:hypothetical protein
MRMGKEPCGAKKEIILSSATAQILEGRKWSKIGTAPRTPVFKKQIQ